MKATTLTNWKGKGERSSSVQAACDEGDDTYFLEGEGGVEFISAGCMQRRRRHLRSGMGRGSGVRQRTLHATRATILTSWKWKGERSSSAHAACDEGDDTHQLEVEGGAEFVSAGCMRRRRRHLLPGRGRGSGVHQRRLHATKATTLTSWKGKGERSSSAQASCDEGNDTYVLEGEGGAEFVSAGFMRRRRRHLRPGRGRESEVLQRRLHATKAKTLTNWKGKGEQSSSAQAACDEGDDTYFLEGEGGEELGNGVRQRRLHATKATTLTLWKGKGERSSSAQDACDEGNDTYSLEGEGGAGFVSAGCMRRRRRHLLSGRGRESGVHQRRLHPAKATKATTLTLWKGEGERSSSAQDAWDEGDDTYELEGEGEAEFISVGCMRRRQRRRRHLRTGKGRESGVHQRRLHATKATTLTNWKGKGERSLSAQAACDEGDDTYGLEGEGGAELVTTLTRWRGKGERSLSAQAACDEGDDTYGLEGEGRAEFVSAGCMRRRRRHLRTGRGRGSGVHQRRLHAVKATTLTIWKGKGERSSSAQAACGEGEDTYALEGEGGAEFVSAGCMRRRRRHLRAGRGRGSGVRQRRLHATKGTTLTSWKGTGERSSSAQAACDEGDDTYLLEGEGGAEFISAGRMRRSQRHLLSGREGGAGMGERSSSAQEGCDEGDDTYFLEGEGGAEFVSAGCMRRRGRHLRPGRGRGSGARQRRLHATKATTLTSWKGKGDRSSSAQAACGEGDDTYLLEREGGAEFVSAGCMRRGRRHLRAGKGRGSGVRQRKLHATKGTTLTSWKGTGERSWSAQAACDEGDDTYLLEREGGADFVSAGCMGRRRRQLLSGRGRGSGVRQRRQDATKAATLTSWKGKAERSASAQAACDEGDDTYSLEGEGGAEFVSAGSMQRRRRHLRTGTGRGSGVRQRRLHVMKAKTLTCWNGKGERISSAQAAWEEGEDSYSLEGEGGAEFVSAGGMRRRRRHLLSGRGRGSGVRQRRRHATKATYFLEGEGGAEFHQRRLHVTKATTLTLWKGKGERNSSAQAAWHEGEDTYDLEVEGGAEFVSAGGMGRRRRHLLSGRGWGSGVHQRRLHATKATYFLEGEGGAEFRQRRLHATKATTLTLWKGKGERNSSAQAAWDEGDDTYDLEGEGGAEFVSAGSMQRRRRHLLSGTGRGSGVCQRRRHGTKATTLTSWKGKGERSSSAQAACDESDDTYDLEVEGGAEFVSAGGMG
ncbi:hypothetical protein C8J57DRAFT_1244065 [Mycena rebaudengoi]|nr:hypothetical protein C8J57DRAFT_1244065 [Mycena rebaudengoi]